MTTSSYRYKRRADIANRSISLEADHFATCTVMGCGRPTRRAAGIGLDGNHCTYHGQRKARFGSPFAPAIRATDLRPYVKTALGWIKEKRGSEPLVAHTLLCLRGLLDGAGPAERLLATHLGVSALIEDDRDSHRIREFRVVQVAKALHRLASGTHRQWDVALPNGAVAPVEMHVYPKSSGRVLRMMGEEIEELCASVTDRHRDTIRGLKREKFGPHPSQLPGWQPAWRRKLDAVPGSRTRV